MLLPHWFPVKEQLQELYSAVQRSSGVEWLHELLAKGNKSFEIFVPN